MVLTSRTRANLAHVRADLLREFHDQPAEWITEVTASLAEDLLDPARFDDFVPLLVHRRAHELLSEYRGVDIGLAPRMVGPSLNVTFALA